MKISVEPITAEAFAPFGPVLRPRQPGQGRQELIEELQNTRGSARPRLSIAAVAPTPLPLTSLDRIGRFVVLTFVDGTASQ